MASIFEKPPFFKLSRPWNEKSKLPEVYKLQSNNPCNKCKAEVHKDSGAFGIELTLDCFALDFDSVAKNHCLGFGRLFV
jgi:hypothetical protein